VAAAIQYPLPTGVPWQFVNLVPHRKLVQPLLQVVYNRVARPANQRRNQLEEAALSAGVRGFAWTALLEWLVEQGLDYVIHPPKEPWY
jgi:hypothetical protein